MVVIGASGFVGGAFAKLAEEKGYEVVRVTRDVAKLSTAERELGAWREFGEGCIDGADVVVNTAGATVGKRWNAAYKKVMWASRVDVTEQICAWLQAAKKPARVWVNVSAIAIYGDSGERALPEEAAPQREAQRDGAHFLQELCLAWEAATQVYALPATRVVMPRLGVVLGGQGDAWLRMKRVFQWGMGGRLGNGEQWFSWVSIDDVVGAMMYLVEHEVAGAVNVVAPESVKNKVFTQCLAGVLHRPALFPVPRFALKFVLGEFASELLASYRVVPQRLIEGAYSYHYPSLKEALDCICREN